MAAALNLHTCRVQLTTTIFNRLHMLFHFTALCFLVYYRITTLPSSSPSPSTLTYSLLTFAELILIFVWITCQGFRWRPVVRKAYPEHIPASAELPGLDVMICTADPEKEPTVEVMNTVISSMALDYPIEKLSVYLSDDGGAPVTLYGIKEACRFAKMWVPFCKKYAVKTICPEAFFSSIGDDERVLRGDEFKAEEQELKKEYELFKKNVESVGQKVEASKVRHDRGPCVEIVHDPLKSGEQDDQQKLPLLVYVSREKRPSYPHRFKAGALNALLRVSGILSNGAYILVLDCDMYCNDPTSAKQAMCFNLDPEISDSHAFVQYPQIFYNVSKNDIYDGQARSAYKTKWQGMDGLQGPSLAGTGFYLKRKALFGRPRHEDMFLDNPEKNFGLSKKLTNSLKGMNENVPGEGYSTESNIKEAQLLATCTYEANTNWGNEVGFSYECFLESTFTGYLLQCRGWTSKYLYPERPQFLGCTTIDMKDAMVTLMKWSSALIQVGFSKSSPLIYGISRMSIPQVLCFAYFSFSHLLGIALLIYGTIPQLGLLRGISYYPKVSDPWFSVFAIVYLSSLVQHLYEVLSGGDSLKTLWNEQRIWVIRLTSACVFGILDAISNCLGLKKAKLRLSNKAVAKEKLDKYEKGVFDFGGAATFMIPVVLLAVLNLVCFIGGVWRMVIEKNYEDMFAQVFMSVFYGLLSYPILEGIVNRKHEG